jgi:hypothetical protein
MEIGINVIMEISVSGAFIHSKTPNRRIAKNTSSEETKIVFKRV